MGTDDKPELYWIGFEREQHSGSGYFGNYLEKNQNRPGTDCSDCSSAGGGIPALAQAENGIENGEVKIVAMILKKFLFFMQPFGAMRDIDSEKGNEPFENRPVYSRDDDINETLQRYSDMVYKLAFARTKNQSDAEDIFQEVFLKYISSGTSFASEEHKKAWLITVTINQSKKLFSSAWIRHRASLADAAEQAVPPLQLADEEGVAAAVLKLPAA